MIFFKERPKRSNIEKRISEGKICGIFFMLKTFNLWARVGWLFAISNQPAFIIKQSRMVEIQYATTNMTYSSVHSTI